MKTTDSRWSSIRIFSTSFAIALAALLHLGAPLQAMSEGGCLVERLEIDLAFNDTWHGGSETDPPTTGCDPWPAQDCDWDSEQNAVYRWRDEHHQYWLEGAIDEHNHEVSAYPGSCGNQ